MGLGLLSYRFQIQFWLGLICSCLSTVYARPLLEQISYSILPYSGNVLVWFIQTCCVAIMYLIIYFGVASAFEYTHPNSAFTGKNTKETQKRWENIKYSIYYSSIALIICVFYAMFWIRFIDPFLPYYGYWANHSYSIFSFFKELLIYMFLFDTWFYWTHRFLHIRWPINIWKSIHVIHHTIVAPTAFAQDATHPFEALLQGPMGHHLINLLAPIHPVSHAIFGFCTAIFAIAAHDARQYDLNSHHKHHYYAFVNFGLYWALWDWICGTRYQEGKYKKLKKWGEDPFAENAKKE